MSKDFRILHISDLHFVDANNSLLKQKMKKHCDDNEYDYYFVTGDISDDGAEANLENAHQWLFGKDENSLSLDPCITMVTPGNHDAMDPDARGLSKRMQVSLENYSRVFSETNFTSSDLKKHIYYKWITDKKSNVNMFVVNINSCYLDDRFRKKISFNKIAQGKIIDAQIYMLTQLCDMGCSGALLDENDNEIPVMEFIRSVKVVVMHHFLFDMYSSPKQMLDKINERFSFLKVKNAAQIQNNLFMYNIELLLCGHSHVNEATVHTLKYHFDKRAKKRYVLNIIRRCAGMQTKPLVNKHNGKYLSRPLRGFVSLIRSHTQTKEQTRTILNTICSGLDESNSSQIKNEIRRFLNSDGIVRFDTEEIAEIKELNDYFYTTMNKAKKNKLAKLVAREVRSFGRCNMTNCLLQGMSGSTVKNYSSGVSKQRSFREYVINRREIRLVKYEWNHHTNDFDKIDENVVINRRA